MNRLFGKSKSKPATTPTVPEAQVEPQLQQSTSSTQQETVVLDDQLRFPRRKSLNGIPPEVTKNDCELYLRNVIGCSKVVLVGDESTAKETAIFSACFPETELEVIVKAYRFGTMKNCFTLRKEKLGNEINAYQHGHPNIARFHLHFDLYYDQESSQFFLDSEKSSEKTDHLFGAIVIEKMQFSLDKFVNDEFNSKLNQDFIKMVYDQIGCALHFLHEFHLTCHGDLNMKNICVAHSPNGDIILKLIDFESSSRYNINEFNEAKDHYSIYSLRKAKFTKAESDTLMLNNFINESVRLCMTIVEKATDLKFTSDAEKISRFQTSVRMPKFQECKKNILRILTNYLPISQVLRE